MATGSWSKGPNSSIVVVVDVQNNRRRRRLSEQFEIEIDSVELIGFFLLRRLVRRLESRIESNPESRERESVDIIEIAIEIWEIDWDFAILEILDFRDEK